MGALHHRLAGEAPAPRRADHDIHLRRIRCVTSPTGYCRVGRKAAMIEWLGVARTAELTRATMELAERLGDPLLILLNNGGAALFVAGQPPKRIAVSKASVDVRLARLARCLSESKPFKESFEQCVARAFAG